MPIYVRAMPYLSELEYQVHFNGITLLLLVVTVSGIYWFRFDFFLLFRHVIIILAAVRSLKTN